MRYKLHFEDETAEDESGLRGFDNADWNKASAGLGMAVLLSP